MTGEPYSDDELDHMLGSIEPIDEESLDERILRQAGSDTEAKTAREVELDEELAARAEAGIKETQAWLRSAHGITDEPVPSAPKQLQARDASPGRPGQTSGDANTVNSWLKDQRAAALRRKRGGGYTAFH